MRLTFGEKIEVDYQKDQIILAIENKNRYWNNVVTMALRKIAQIAGKKESNNTIKELGLEKLGFKIEKS